MPTLFPISRIWPRLARTLLHRHALLRSYEHSIETRHFVPMAVMLDESQAYKPSSTNLKKVRTY